MGSAPSTQTVYEKFDDIKTKFEKELKDRASVFENQIYDLTLNKKVDLKTETALAISNDVSVVNAEVKPEDLKTANEKAKSDPAPTVKPPVGRDGKSVDMNAKPSENQLIVLYNDQTMIVQQSNETDFAGLKESISKITNAVAGTFPAKGDEKSTGGMLSNLASNPQKVADSINTVVSGILGMCSTSSNVGLNSHSNVQYVPPGIYVGCLTFSSSVQTKNSRGSNSVVMWLVKTIVCTSLHLMNSAIVHAQVLEKLQTNRIARLNVVQALGKVIGIANASDLGTTIFSPVDSSDLVKDVADAEKSADKHPTGTLPPLRDLDQPQAFAQAVEWNDKEGKATGWDIVLKMYRALGRMGDLNTGGGINERFDERSKLYQDNIGRLSGKVKDDYRLLRDELKQEEDNLMALLRK